jgi:hypothetical protein
MAAAPCKMSCRNSSHITHTIMIQAHPKRQRSGRNPASQRAYPCRRPYPDAVMARNFDCRPGHHLERHNTPPSCNSGAPPRGLPHPHAGSDAEGANRVDLAEDKRFENLRISTIDHLRIRYNPPVIWRDPAHINVEQQSNSGGISQKGRTPIAHKRQWHACHRHNA